MGSKSPEDQIRSQLETVFSRAEYPVTDPFELIPVLPNGAATTFEADDITIGAMELGREYSEYQEYPYEDVEGLVDDLMTGLHDNDMFDSNTNC